MEETVHLMRLVLLEVTIFFEVTRLEHDCLSRLTKGEMGLVEGGSQCFHYQYTSVLTNG